MPLSLNVLSRRRFLQGSVGVLASAVWPSWPVFAAEAAKPDRLALLSDVHVSGAGKGNMAAYLQRAVGRVLAAPVTPDAVLVAGDCAHLRGKVDDYRDYLRLVRPLADAGLALHMTLGNHDHRERFWDALPGELTAAGRSLQRQAGMVPGRHADWILLDSLHRTNRGAGELGDDQLQWLAAMLDARGRKPVILMMHHNPQIGGRGGSLRDSDRLLEIVRPRRQVKALFFGHTHIWRTAIDRSGVHLVNLPATGYTLWLRSFVGSVDVAVHPGGAVLDVHPIKAGDAKRAECRRLIWRAG